MSLLRTIFTPNKTLIANSEKEREGVEQTRSEKENASDEKMNTIRDSIKEVEGLARQGAQVLSSSNRIGRRLERRAANYGALSESVISNLDIGGWRV